MEGTLLQYLLVVYCIVIALYCSILFKFGTKLCPELKQSRTPPCHTPNSVKENGTQANLVVRGVHLV